MDVGWIGLGAMGMPMATCLVNAGFRVIGFDADPGRTAMFEGESAGSIAAAASTADVLAVMVATPDQLEAVLFGPDGAAASLRAGAVVLVMATVGVDCIEQTAQRLATRSVDVVDAPVSGGVTRARAGDLLFMVSGPQPAREHTRALIEVMARESADFGDHPGDAQKAKLVNQLLCGVHIAVAGEALAFAEALGLDMQQCWSALRSGAATSFMFEDRGARMVAGTYDDVRSALGIFVKDLGLVTAEAASCGQRAEIAEAAYRAFLDGKDAGLIARDDSSVLEVMRARRE